MYYATHCISPCLSIVAGEAEYVSCFGSGRIHENLIARYGSPFAVETAHISLRDSDVCARVYSALFDTARQYRESFDVFGSKMSIEWPLIEGEGLILHTAKQPQAKMAQRTSRRITPSFSGADPSLHHQDLSRSAGIRASPAARAQIRTERTPISSPIPVRLKAMGARIPISSTNSFPRCSKREIRSPTRVQSANITCAGILAHESAMKGGVLLRLPDFA